MKHLMGLMWSFAFWFGLVTFVANPEKAMKDAFKVARSPGPQFSNASFPKKSEIRFEDLTSDVELERLRQEGLRTIEQAQRMNAASLAE